MVSLLRRARPRVACFAIALAACSRNPGLAVNTGPLPRASDAEAEALLVDLGAADPSLRIEMRYAGAHNFTGAPIEGYGANRAFLRHEAAYALLRVERRLQAQGLALKIWDAYRPLRATEAQVAWAEAQGREDLLRDGYLARTSRHNLGLAVDCTLVEQASGKELEMGSAYDEFPRRAHRDYGTSAVRRNRARLAEAMRSVGFVPYEKEWWHFSYLAARPRVFDWPIPPKQAPPSETRVHPDVD